MKATLFSAFLLPCTITALCLMAGCGGASDGRLTATGTVTLDGAPLPSGNIVFYKDNTSAGVGQIVDGSFSLSEAGNSEGIQPGTYLVAIESWEVEPNSVDEDGNIVGEGKSRIPTKYNATGTSGLTAEVSPDNAAFEFSLTSE